MKIKRTKTNDLQDTAMLLLEAKRKKDQADQEYKLAQEILTEKLKERQQKSATFTDGGKQYKLTYVATERATIDEAALRKEMGAAKFDKYTVKKLDNKKLQAAITDGSVDPVLVGKHTEVKTSAPYVRVTEQAAEDDG